MALNSNILMSAQPIGTANALFSATQAANNNKAAQQNRTLTDEQITGAQGANQDAEQQRLQNSYINAALRTKAHLENNDVQGLERYYTQRINEINARGGDPSETTMALEKLQGGNYEELMAGSNSVIQAAQQGGLLGGKDGSRVQQAIGVPGSGFQVLRSDGSVDFVELPEDQRGSIDSAFVADANRKAEAAALKSGASEGAKLDVQLEKEPILEGEKDLAKGLAQDRAKTITGIRKFEARIRNLKNSSSRVIAQAEKAISNINAWTGGPGALLKAAPGTAQRDLAELIKTIEANIGFDKLQAMRESSPTGGALGQVAVEELRQLQRNIASLDLGQSPSTIRENLALVVDAYNGYVESSQIALDEDLRVAREGFAKEMSGEAGAQKDDPLQSARDAISRGADRDAVIDRLIENGINPKGL